MAVACPANEPEIGLGDSNEGAMRRALQTPDAQAAGALIEWLQTTT
jgi:hypothetical protein